MPATDAWFVGETKRRVVRSVNGRGRQRWSPSAAGAPSIARWTVLCAGAETLGVTAAAAAAALSRALIADRSTGSGALVALALIVAGGLVEGLALGGFQAAALGRWLPNLRRSHWIVVTAAVAGVGWAAASVPSVLGDDGRGSEPPWVVVVGGAVLLGAGMGAVLGAAQALVVRVLVPHPGRWVGANVVAWVPAMTVIFVGASTPRADWPAAGVVAFASATGLVAGAVLGVLTGWFLPTLAGPPPHNLAVLAVLHSPAHRLFDRSLVALRLRGVRSGEQFEFPVSYAADAAGLVIVPGNPQAKHWWRNLRTRAPVEFLFHGRWLPAEGVVLEPGAEMYDVAIATYRRRWRHVHVSATQPVVRIWPVNDTKRGLWLRDSE